MFGEPRNHGAIDAKGHDRDVNSLFDAYIHMAASDEGHQQVHRDGTVGRTVTHVTDPRAQLVDWSKPECAQASRRGDGQGQPGAGQATTHAGLGDRNVETEPVKQVHVLSVPAGPVWRQRRRAAGRPYRRAPRIRRGVPR